MQRAPEIRLTEGHAAVHAPGSLRAPRLFRLPYVQILKIPQPFCLASEGILYSYCVQKSCRAAHSLTSLIAKDIHPEGPGVSHARKTSQWLVFSKKRAEAPGTRKALGAAAAAKSLFFR
jgi:hypothetical protein